MAEKSEVVVLDVLYQNESSHQEILEIMRQQHIYLEREFNEVVPSGGDLLTCESQRYAQEHVMDSDTREERLKWLEPLIEDWHTLVSFAGKSSCKHTHQFNCAFQLVELVQSSILLLVIFLYIIR